LYAVHLQGLVLKWLLFVAFFIVIFLRLFLVHIFVLLLLVLVIALMKAGSWAIVYSIAS
jgi:hypothetical protein